MIGPHVQESENPPRENLTSQSQMVFAIGPSPEPVNSVGVIVIKLSGQKEANETERGAEESEK